MKTNLKNLALLLIFFAGHWVFAQYSTVSVKRESVQTTSNTVAKGTKRKAYLAKRHVGVYLGANTLAPNTDTKDLGVGNPIGINLGISKSLWSNDNISLGLHGFGEYSFGNGKIDASKYPILKISGATSNTSVVSTTPKMSGFGIGVGPQVNFGWGENFMVSPILDFAYLNQKMDEYSVMQTSVVGGSNVNAILYKQNKIDASGLGIIPRLRLNYLISKNIGIWLEGNYVMGPKITTTSYTFKPSGNPAQDGTYNIDYIKTGTNPSTEVSTNGGGIGFGGGIVIGLGGKTPEPTTNTSSTQKSASGCDTCSSLAVSSLQFPSSGGTSINPGGTINIPYNASNASKTMRVEVSPHPYNTLNTGVWASEITILVNGATASVSTGGNPYTHNMGSNASARLIPFSSLNVGANTVCVKVKCTSSGVSCQVACFTVNVDGPPSPPSGNITATPECCTETKYVVMPGNPHTAVTSYTGKVRFKMSGTVTNAKLKIVSAGNTSYESFVPNAYTNCYTRPVNITLVDYSGNPIPTSTVNGVSSYTNSYYWKSCINLQYVEIKKNLAFLALKTIGLSGDYTDVSSETDGSSVYFVTKANDPITGTVKTVKILLEKEDGNNQLYLTGTPVLTTEVKGKLVSTKTLEPISSKKHNYVGHVTLLK